MGSKFYQILTDREGFVYVHPMRSKSQYGKYLNVVTRDIGVPKTLISYNAGKQTGTHTELQECICRCRIGGRTTEPYSTCHNISEGMIKILKYKDELRRIRRRVPKRIRDFSLV